MFVLDTNTLIYFSRGESAAKDFLLSGLSRNYSFSVSIISVVEFLSYPDITQADENFFHTYAEQFLKIHDLNYQSAVEAALLRKKYKLKLGDSIIASVALMNNAILVSRDKDFKKVKELEILEL